MADQMQDNTSRSSQEHNKPSFIGASSCDSCGTIGEFDLPADEGVFEIACFECEHIYEIDAKQALQDAATQEPDPELTNLEVPTPELPATELTEAEGDDGEAPASETPIAQQFEDIDPDAPTRFALPPIAPPQKTGKTSIILVSILSAGLVITASMVALGLYFLTLRTDSDVTRYIETNILQLAPASFEVQNASYEISDTELGTSLLVTVTISNNGQIEGAPEEMKVVLVDANNQPLITWPLDIAGQLIAPGEATQLYTRLFEPPADFANLRVFVR